jgi:polyferredoxin
MTEHGISAAGMSGLITYFFILALIAVLALLLGKRGMCHSICWMAPFMILGTKLKEHLPIPSLKLTADSSACISCKQCSRKCPMSLEVQEMVSFNNMNNSECILCGECADTCPKKLIKLSFHNTQK